MALPGFGFESLTGGGALQSSSSASAKSGNIGPATIGGVNFAPPGANNQLVIAGIIAGAVVLAVMSGRRRKG